MIDSGLVPVLEGSFSGCAPSTTFVAQGPSLAPAAPAAPVALPAQANQKRQFGSLGRDTEHGVLRAIWEALRSTAQGSFHLRTGAVICTCIQRNRFSCRSPRSPKTRRQWKSLSRANKLKDATPSIDFQASGFADENESQWPIGWRVVPIRSATSAEKW
jgi:hypothetical protein